MANNSPSALRFPFGREKDKPLNECNKGSLKFYIKNLKLGNPKYDAGNIAMAKECLMYLNMNDIQGLVDEEVDGGHPAFQLCMDAINAITDGKRKPGHQVHRDLPTIQLEPKHPSAKVDFDKGAILAAIQALIDDVEKHAAELQQLFTEYDEQGKPSTKSSEHTPF